METSSRRDKNTSLQVANDLQLQLWDLGRSPINVSLLEQLLQNYPDCENAKCLANGFKFGFKLNYIGDRKRIEFKNMLSTQQFVNEILVKIDKEIELGRVLDPFLYPPISYLRCNPIGILPKKQGGWRMITNLSYPIGDSVNDYIDSELCSVNYSTFDDALKVISAKGEGALMAKMDVSNAFRLLPICPQDFCLLGFKIADLYYIDKCLPMGCSISCSLFEKFSTFLHWEVQHRSNIESIVHYLDDFLFIGDKSTDECQILMCCFQELCKGLGVPLAVEKTEGPTTRICFLGLGIDTITQTIFIPEDKRRELLLKIQNVLSCKKVTLKQLQSLVGALAFVVKALPAGRAFSRRIYGAMEGVKKSFHFIRITSEIRMDLQMWVQFLLNFNGTTPFPLQHWHDSEFLEFFTDSSGAYGCGVVFGNHWSCLSWPTYWSSDIIRDITLLELVPIVLGMSIWSSKLKNLKLLLHVDNMALVQNINQKKG